MRQEFAAGVVDCVYFAGTLVIGASAHGGDLGGGREESGGDHGLLVDCQLQTGSSQTAVCSDTMAWECDNARGL